VVSLHDYVSDGDGDAEAQAAFPAIEAIMSERFVHATV
jgi:hypothetical protein